MVVVGAGACPEKILRHVLSVPETIVACPKATGAATVADCENTPSGVKVSQRMRRAASPPLVVSRSTRARTYARGVSAEHEPGAFVLRR